MELHQRRIVGVALRLTGNIADAEDAAQEVFVRLHRNLNSLPDAASVLPWLHRVTVNVCLDQKRRTRTVPIEGLALVCASADPESAAASRETGEHLQMALLNLGERERAALILRDLEGLSTAEVAATLGSTESTVRVQIARARLKLRELLKGVRR